MKPHQSAAFEVRCDRCRVTFPLGTRRCIHCGGPTTTSRGDPRLRLEPAGEPEAVAAEVEQEPTPRRFLSPSTLAWVAVIAAGYLYRACAGQAP